MPDEIEFLDAGPVPGEDEQLSEPLRSGLPGSPRMRGIVALVVVIVGGLILRGVTSGGSGAAPSTVHGSPALRPDPVVSAESNGGRLTSPADILCAATKPSSEPTTTDPATTDPTTTDPATTDPATKAGMVTCASGDPSKCSTADACTPTGEIPQSVVTAVRVRFPGATFSVGSTDIVRQTAAIWYRYVKLSALHHTTIQVLIQQRTFDPGLAGDVDNGTKQITRSVHRGRDLTTIVQITRPSGTRQVVTAGSLARDPRLLAVG